MPRKILIAVGALAAVLVLAVGALFFLVDVNAFKPRIEQAVSGQLNRTLRIDGELKLAVFPRIAVALPRTTLSERASDQPFAQLDSARIAVAVLPLLKGRIEADRIRISGLTATLQQRKDGSTNIDDLIGAEGAGKPTPPAGAPAQTPQFDIGGVELIDAQLTLRGPDGSLLQLSKLNLSTGRLAPRTRTLVSLAGEFASAPNKAQGSARIEGEIDIDLQSKRYGVRQLAVSGTGKLGSESFELSLTAPELVFGDTTRGEKLQLKAKLAGTQAVDVTVDLSGFSGSAKEVTVQALQLSANLQQAGRKVVARLASPVQFAVELQQLRLPKLAGEVFVDDPALPQKSVKLPIAGSLALDAKKQIVDARIDTKFDDTALKAAVDVAGFAQPRIRFEVDADQLNVDRYLPPEAEGKGGGAKAPAAAETKLDLGALRGLNLNGSARIGQLQAKGVKAASVRVGVKAAGGRLDVTPLAAQLYGGSLNGAAFAIADGNRVGLNANLAGVAIEPLLRDALDKELLAGRGNVQLAVSTRGETVAAMRRALDGKAALQLRDGAIKGINIAQKFREAKAMLRGGAAAAQQADMSQKTDFTEMSASFVIADGVATGNDLDAKSPLLRLGGAGRIDIGAGNIDYTAQVSVVGSLRGQDGRDIEELRGVTIPVRLSGPFEQMSYQIDWGGVAREALKAKAAEEIKKRISPQVDQQRKQIEDRAKDALKGLFGR